MPKCPKCGHQFPTEVFLHLDGVIDEPYRIRSVESIEERTHRKWIVVSTKVLIENDARDIQDAYTYPCAGYSFFDFQCNRQHGVWITTWECYASAE